MALHHLLPAVPTVPGRMSRIATVVSTRLGVRVCPVQGCFTFRNKLNFRPQLEDSSVASRSRHRARRLVLHSISLFCDVLKRCIAVARRLEQLWRHGRHAQCCSGPDARGQRRQGHRH